jgi:hypothetical protein
LPFSGDSFVIQDYSSLAFRGFANMRVRPKIKNTSLDPSVQGIKIVQHPEQLLEPYGVLFKEMENKSSSQHNVSAKKRKTINITKTLF